MKDSTLAILLGGAALSLSLYVFGRQVKHDVKKCAAVCLAGKYACKAAENFELCYCGDEEEAVAEEPEKTE